MYYKTVCYKQAKMHKMPLKQVSKPFSYLTYSPKLDYNPRAAAYHKIKPLPRTYYLRVVIHYNPTLNPGNGKESGLTGEIMGVLHTLHIQERAAGHGAY